MMTPGGYGIGPFAPMINSLRKITPAGSGGDPAAGHSCRDGGARRHAAVAGQPDGLSRFRLERFLSLNGLAPNSRLVPGQKVKLVVLRHAPQLIRASCSRLRSPS